ncbi:cation-translocating P-type ATPase [Flavobacterium coralii]|uniref:cation-translocating P-type ATPase n=1 Tax=Flavobacterium coralii TaxID=2838017 RepID=UPI000C5CE864|nr:ATPase [Flavobacterium sp.]|tara:strand:- start:89561 stop:92179 length:2619 start_codon:yes stop_codon:yes gene_type:complete
METKHITIPINQFITQLASDKENGLLSDEAIKRLQKFGSNVIQADKGKSPLRILLEQFNSLMVWLLLFAAGLSFWFQEYLDATAILLVILINAVVGFWMELQALRSMNALKKMASVPSKVFRDGKLIEIPSEELVPGDVLFLEAGDIITADARIIQAAQLSVNEASLTGEAMPVEKKETELPEKTPLAERTNMLHKGTYVTNGNAKALVTATGMQTELGKIAHLVQSAKQSATPLEKKLQVFSRKLIYITIILVVLIFVVGLLTHGDYVEMLETAIALAVAAIPEGLPIVATLALAQGMMKMAKHKIIVKKLAAVETLGGTTIICTDKTGTLTQNKIEVSEVIPVDIASEKNKELLTRIGMLCNTASVEINNNGVNEIGDPLETGLLKYAYKQGVLKEQVEKIFPKINEVPFSSETKMMATLHKNGNGFTVFAKGAAEELLNQCTFIVNGYDKSQLTEQLKDEWKQKAEKLAASGLRIIAGAYKETTNENTPLLEDLIFAGLYCMIDPPAEDVYQAIQEAKDAGIRVVMITGDHPATANCIANQLHISSENEPISGKDMQPYEHLTEIDKQKWLQTSVFARVTPAQKLDLVTVLQEQGNIVGMTGDGVNDAPALKKADIGIAMGQRGTQVAQEVSDMVLKDDAFSSIVHAIKQGRIIFSNIQKFVIYLLSCNMSELFVVSLAALSNLHFQLLPLQILFINLVTDVLPALALGVSEGNPYVMKHNPRNPSEPLLKTKQWYAVWVYAAVISVCTLGAVFVSHYFIHAGTQFDPKLCNNILFFTLIFCQLFHVFNMASAKVSFFKSEVFRNRYVWYALLSCTLIILALFFATPVKEALNIQPLNTEDWVVVFVSATCSLLVIQLLKRLKIIHDED